MATQHRILLIEDSDDTRDLLLSALRSFGHHAIGASSAKEAIKAFTSTNSFELVLTDISLPDMNGFDLIAELQKRGIQKQARIVIFSAWTFTEKQLANARVDGILQKPIDLEKLNSEILRILALSR